LSGLPDVPVAKLKKVFGCIFSGGSKNVQAYRQNFVTTGNLACREISEKEEALGRDYRV
jgi:hypothetical protein